MKPHRTHPHRGYTIQEDHWIQRPLREWATFTIYDETGECLHEAKTLNAAKDWIDAEQAGEHDRQEAE